jgi:hypothetical protein
MSAERLALGDLVECPDCHLWHPARRPRGAKQSDPRADWLFITCRAAHLVGQVGQPALQPARVKCPSCFNDRWVCEEHPTQPMHHDDRCRGAGIPCPRCNANEPPHPPPGWESYLK